MDTTAPQQTHDPVNEYLALFARRWVQAFSEQRKDLKTRGVLDHYEQLKSAGLIPSPKETSLHTPFFEVIVKRPDLSTFTIPTFFIHQEWSANDRSIARYHMFYPFLIVYVPMVLQNYTVPLLAVNLGAENDHPLSYIFYEYAERYDVAWSDHNRLYPLKNWFVSIETSVAASENKTLPSSVAEVEKMAHHILDAAQGFFSFFMPFLPTKDGRLIPGLVKEVLCNRVGCIRKKYKQPATAATSGANRRAKRTVEKRRVGDPLSSAGAETTGAVDGVIDIQFRKTWRTVSQSEYPNSLHSHRYAAYGFCYGAVVQQMCRMNVTTSKDYIDTLFSAFIAYMNVALGSISEDISRSDAQTLARVYGVRNTALEAKLKHVGLIDYDLVDLQYLKSQIAPRIRMIAMQLESHCGSKETIDALLRSGVNFDGERIINGVEEMCRHCLVEPRTVHAIGQLVYAIPYHCHHFA